MSEISEYFDEGPRDFSPVILILRRPTFAEREETDYSEAFPATFAVGQLVRPIDEYDVRLNRWQPSKQDHAVNLMETRLA